MIRKSVDFAGSGSWSQNWDTSDWEPMLPCLAVSWSQYFPRSYSLPGSWAKSGAWVKNRNDSWHWRDNL